MNKIIYALLCLIICSACFKEDEQARLIQEKQYYSREQVDNIITTSLKKKNEFMWQYVNAEVLSSALIIGDSLLTIGYQPENVSNIDAQLASIDIRNAAWQNAKNKILSNIVSVLSKYSPRPVKTSDILIREDEVLPFFVIKATSIELIKVLRKLSTVRYIEPLGYSFEEVDGTTLTRAKGSLGCLNVPNLSIRQEDYQVVTPNAKASWNICNMKAPQAWKYGTGRGIGIAIIDTGTSPDQDKLGKDFNQGESTGRKIYRYGTFKDSLLPWAEPDGPDDKCGHGTQMAGACVAPRGTDGTAVGVAYNADLISIRGTSDVVIMTSNEQYGVIDALKLSADRQDVRIISMSIGTPLWSSSVADAMRYAYGKQKLIFCAAGTTTYITKDWFGVVFPASMNEAVAVTGVIEGQYIQCDLCHKGSKVDFSMEMQRGNNWIDNPLTLAMEGNIPSRVGGSSVATATTAGIAALVWSTNPSMTREQVLDRLTQAAELYPNNRNANFGWGKIDVLKAVMNN